MEAVEAVQAQVGKEFPYVLPGPEFTAMKATEGSAESCPQGHRGGVQNQGPL